MRTLGTVILTLLALFFGGCALLAGVTSFWGGWWFLCVAIIAGGLFFACRAGIKALADSALPKDVPPQKSEKPDPDQSI